MNSFPWVENPGVYLGKEHRGGIIISGPMSINEAHVAAITATNQKEGLVVIHKSPNGEWPVLEIIMELLYRKASG